VSGLAIVRIVNDKTSFEVPDGARLLDYARERMPFGCESGTCGMCICTIVRGRENLNAPQHEEWMALQKKGARSSQRLACQIWVMKGEVEIEY
jgi:ferredoxin